MLILPRVGKKSRFRGAFWIRSALGARRLRRFGRFGRFLCGRGIKVPRDVLRESGQSFWAGGGDLVAFWAFCAGGGDLVAFWAF